MLMRKWLWGIWNIYCWMKHTAKMSTGQLTCALMSKHKTHAAQEPRAAIARFNDVDNEGETDHALEIWTGTQDPFGIKRFALNGYRTVRE